VPSAVSSIWCNSSSEIIGFVAVMAFLVISRYALVNQLSCLRAAGRGRLRRRFSRQAAF
jgi:hypothetical protein